MQTQKIKTRFAPSPTGFMHVGNLRTCLYAYLFTRGAGGEFILRIEDTDQARFVEGATEAILSTLSLSGISFDGEPIFQSERKDVYKSRAEELVKKGGAYYCFCDKNRLDTLGEIKKYDKHCLSLTNSEVEEKLSASTPYVIRQNVPVREGACEYVDMVYGKVSVPYAEIEDGVLLKSDGMPTYNFANVVDDYEMGITHVIRGNEYLSSTPKYNLIYQGFGWQCPSYMHLAPVMRDAQNKLSKRNGDVNFEDFVAKGFLPEALINYIALLGWSPADSSEKMTLSEMIEKFSPDGISKSGSIFDEKKLRWLNQEYIKELTDEDFMARTGITNKALAHLLKTRVETLAECDSKSVFTKTFPADFPLTMFENAKQKIDLLLVKQVLPALYTALQANTDWSDAGVKLVLQEVVATLGLKTGQVFMPFRLAITGLEQTPGGGAEVASVLGKEETLTRLNKTISRF